MTYLLVGGEVRKCSMAEFLASLEGGRRFARRTVVGAMAVQTCFTGLDMSQNENAPKVFETCVVARDVLEMPVGSIRQMEEKASKMQGSFMGAVYFSSTYSDAIRIHEEVCSNLGRLQACA